VVPGIDQAVKVVDFAWPVDLHQKFARRPNIFAISRPKYTTCERVGEVAMKFCQIVL